MNNNPFQDILDWYKEQHKSTLPPEVQPEIVIETPQPFVSPPDIPIPDIKCER